jgi:hypothetical protein
MKDMFLKPLINPENYRFEKVDCYGCGANNYAFFLMGEEDLTGRRPD